MINKLLLLLFFFSAKTIVFCAEENPLNELYLKLKKHGEEYSFDIQDANNSYEQKLSAAHSSWAESMPSLNASVNQEFNPDEREFGANKRGQIILKLDYPLLDRRRYISKKLANKDADLSLNAKNIAEKQLTLALRDIFGGYIIQSVKIFYVLRTIKRSTTNFEYIEKGFKLGRNSKLDVLRAKANVDLFVNQANLEMELLEQAKEKILNFTGMPKAEFDTFDFKQVFREDRDTLNLVKDFTKIDQLLANFKKVKEYFQTRKENEIPQDIYSSSLLFQKINHEENFQLIKAENITSAEWPSISLRSTLTRENESIARSLGSNTTDNMIFGVYVNIPLFSFGTFFSSKNEREYERANIKINRLKKELAYKNSMNKDVENIDNITNTIEIQSKLVEQNDEIAKLSLLSYKLKRSDLQDLLTAENNLLNSKARLIEEIIRLSTILRNFFFKLGSNQID